MEGVLDLSVRKPPTNKSSNEHSSGKTNTVKCSNSLKNDSSLLTTANQPPPPLVTTPTVKRRTSSETKPDESNKSNGDKSSAEHPGDGEKSDYEIQRDIADKHIELASQHAEMLANAFQQNLSDYYAYMSLMPPMFDTSTGMIIPPPPPPSSVSSGGRGK